MLCGVGICTFQSSEAHLVLLISVRGDFFNRSVSASVFVDVGHRAVSEGSVLRCGHIANPDYLDNMIA